MSLSFEFHLKGQGDHGESINKPKRKSRLKIAAGMEKKTTSLQLILCQDPPITVVQESAQSLLYFSLLITYNWILCLATSISQIVHLTHEDLFVSIRCIPNRFYTSNSILILFLLQFELQEIEGPNNLLLFKCFPSSRAPFFLP